MKRKIEKDVYYSDFGKGQRGWFAVYTDENGDAVDDSAKIWHPTMPIRRDAEKKANRIAAAYCRGLNKEG